MTGHPHGVAIWSDADDFNTGARWDEGDSRGAAGAEHRTSENGGSNDSFHADKTPRGAPALTR